jgi:hypothetical protein
MGKRWTIAAAAFSLAACGSSMARSTESRSDHARAASCAPGGARTLASSSSARVYVTAGTVYGCSTHGLRSYVLGSSATCHGSARVATVAVAADLAAFGLERCGVDTGSTVVTVRRLTDDRQLRSFAATTRSLPEAFQSVRSIAIRSTGAVAWIGVVTSIVGHGSVIEVHKADRNRSPALLDSGSAVVPGSLREHGARISWRHGTATRTAPLS